MGTDFWSTTLSGIRRGADWAAVAHYLEPVKRYLATGRRYRWIPEADRDDIAQEVMAALIERGPDTYQSERGRFRVFLQGVIRHKAADYARARGRAPLGPPEFEPPSAEKSAQAIACHEEEEAEAIEFGAKLVLAIRRFHDRYTQASAAERARLYCFIGRLVGGLSQEEIARKEGLSRDQVKRHLAAARDEILAELVELVADAGDSRSKAVVRGISRLVRDGLREPDRITRLVEAEPDDRVREPASRILHAVVQHWQFFFEPGSDAWTQLLRGLAEILSVEGEQLLQAWAR